ncbi:hypothetical protein EGW08_020563, partial [Elysia chlorotica]
GIVNVSKINTQLEKNPHSDVAWTSKPLKPKSFLDSQDPMLKQFRKLCKETAISTSHESQGSSGGNKNDIVMETLCKLLKSVEVSKSPETDLLEHTKKIDPVSPKHTLAKESKSALYSQASSMMCSTLTKDCTSATLNRQNLFPSEMNTTDSGEVDPAFQHERNKRVNLDTGALKNELDALSDERQTFSNTLTSDVYNSSKTCDEVDISWLPPSLHKSRLARLSMKSLRPSVLTAMRGPFAFPINNKGYNSEGSSSTESSFSS